MGGRSLIKITEITLVDLDSTRRSFAVMIPQAINWIRLLDWFL